MQRKKLGSTGVEVSKLGFGCVRLTTHDNKKQAISVLEHAFHNGITHFDVARCYGFGRAEGILGEFLQGKRDAVTVATKFGFELPGGVCGNYNFINILKKALRPFPGLLEKAKKRGGTMVKDGNFTSSAAIKSIETSLQQLRTDYIDILFLHEATILDIANEPLLETLQQQVKKGTVRCLGIASGFDRVCDHLDKIPQSYSILQFNDNIVDRTLNKINSAKQIITHSIYQSLKQVQQAIIAYPQLTHTYSQMLNIDLNLPENMNALFLQYALNSNSAGAVLFSSMNKEHITQNSKFCEENKISPQQITMAMEFIKQVLELFLKNDKKVLESTPA